MLKTYKLCKIISALYILLIAQPASALLIEFVPNASTASSGDSVSIDLFIDGLGAGTPDSLGAFDIDVDYDPGAISFTGGSFESFLGDPLFDAVGSITDLGGTVNLFEVSFLSDSDLDFLQPSRFPLASLNFDIFSLASGSSTSISIGPSTLLSDAFGNQLTLNSVSSAVLTGAMPHTTVSEPTTLSLIGLSSFLLILFRRKRVLSKVGK